MDWLTNEMIFYGGIIITVFTILLAIIYFFVFKIKLERLNNQLNIEYGPKEKSDVV